MVSWRCDVFFDLKWRFWRQAREFWGSLNLNTHSIFWVFDTVWLVCINQVESELWWSESLGMYWTTAGITSSKISHGLRGGNHGVQFKVWHGCASFWPNMAYKTCFFWGVSEFLPFFFDFNHQNSRAKGQVSCWLFRGLLAQKREMRSPDDGAPKSVEASSSEQAWRVRGLRKGDAQPLKKVQFYAPLSQSFHSKNSVHFQNVLGFW